VHPQRALEGRYRLTDPVRTVHARRGLCSRGVVDARWEAKRADGVVTNKAFFNFNYPEFLTVYDTASLAHLTWQPAGARSTANPALARGNKPATQGPRAARETQQADVTVPQNAPTTDVRMRSTLGFACVLNHGDPNTTQIFFSTSSSRYAITPKGFIRYAGAAGSIQKRSGTNGWSVATNFTLDSQGHFEGLLPRPGVRTDYRSVIYDAQYIFGGISNQSCTIDPK
jgi:hypothetical protein